VNPRQMRLVVGPLIAIAIAIAIVVLARARPSDQGTGVALRSIPSSGAPDRPAPSAGGHGAPENDVPAAQSAVLYPSGDVVAGCVVDALGGPVAGALITVRPIWDAPALGVGRSDNHGRFSVAATAGPVRLSAEADGYSRIWRSVVAPAHDVNLPLAPAARIAGTVVAEGTSEPLEGVVVTARSNDGRDSEARSAADGTFALERLAAGRYQIVAVADHWRSRARELDVVVGGQVGSVVIPVARGLAFSGRVLLDGAPCPMAIVTLLGSVTLQARADTDANVRLQGAPPGRYEARVACNAVPPLREAIALERDVAGHVWNIPRGLVIAGTVADAAGAPAARIGIDVLDPARPEANSRCHSDDQGRFECVGLGPGAYAVGASDDWGALGAPVSVTLQDRSVSGVALRLPPLGKIDITVQSAAGRPRDDLPVFAIDEQHAVVSAAPQGGGRFTIPRLPSGRYDVMAGHTRSPTRKSVAVDARATAVAVTLVVAADATIAGRVLDPRNQPVPDVWVSAYDLRVPALRENQAAPALTDADGRFQIGGLVPGSYTVRAAGPAGEAVLESVSTGTPAEIRIDPSTITNEGDRS
jgi:hypothetical protein